MHTIRALAQLLARADSLSALRPLARLLAFIADPLPVSVASRRELGLADLVTNAELHIGAGSLRLLCAVLAPPHSLDDGTTVRERIRRVAQMLARHAPEQAWCLLLLDHDARTVCMVTMSGGGSDLRIAALATDRTRVLDSDAHTWRALAAVTDTADWLRHARFSDILRRDALTHRFYRALDQSVSALADSLSPVRLSAGRRPASGVSPSPGARRELALLCASRCLFLAFLEVKGWLDGRHDFLLHHTLRVLEAGGQLHERLLRPLFFGTLNTPRAARASAARHFGDVPFLNGGLFTPTVLEKRFRHWHFHDDAIAALITGVIDRYRFTAREDSSTWSEAAVDPEMLGRAFEGLMAPEERRRSGSFYTPPHLVSVTVHEALRSALGNDPSWCALLDAVCPAEHTDRDLRAPFAAPPGQAAAPTATTPVSRHRATSLRHQLDALQVLDPACGSGAFLVHFMETLDALYAALHDPRDAHTRRRDILAHAIFGVDRHPMAVWLCELRLWLSVVIECHAPNGRGVPPLPNLDHHIRVGDTLSGGGFQFAPPSARTLTKLRARYVRASGARKQTVAAALDHEERHRAVGELTSRVEALHHERRLLLVAWRGRDLFGHRRYPARADRTRMLALRTQLRELRLARQRLQSGGALPFRFAAMFADVAASGGFSVIIGNPPWVRPHAMPSHERHWLRQEFRSMRHAAWRQGAARAGAATGFAAQADLAVAFVERTVQLLAPGGTLALLVPSKLWCTLSGGGVRQLLLEQTVPRVLHDWSDAPAQFDAATYPSLIVAQRTLNTVPQPLPALASALHERLPSGEANTPRIELAVTRERTVRFTQPVSMLSLQQDVGAPWIRLPAAPFAAFERLRRAGPPLADTRLGRPLLGVKCGCNAAFLVHAVEHQDGDATVTTLYAATPRQAVIERALLRPALRGEAVHHVFGAARAVPDSDTRIVWTHDRMGHPLKALPPATTRWLAHWRPRLQSRRDAKAKQPWWTLFRTDAARFDAPRVVWADIGKQLRSRVLLPGDPTVPLNSCYVVRTTSVHEAWALHALLSSGITAAWLDVLAEPARGGFRRFLGWTVAALPTPSDWPRAVRLLAPVGAAMQQDGAVTRDALDHAVSAAFGCTMQQLHPLLEWYRHD